MDLGPLPPPSPNPNLTQMPPQPWPEEPPNPGKAHLLRGEQQKSPVLLQEITTTSDGANTGQTQAEGSTSSNLCSHTSKVLNTIQKGFLPQRSPEVLDATEWAHISCLLVNAIGHGLLKAAENLKETEVESAIAGATDLAPSEPACPTYFHRLTNMANLLAAHLVGTICQDSLLNNPVQEREVSSKMSR
ncbi:hypothetical protein F5148DRAFT_1291300 [Russula earlei]|uniref:Uncharacterized protein n=1 Tax=Russula earlei TaxID=71964 RepID=A0ACC0TVD5_9AGAM|nr:hypothetical protein F5148DRAFT_1291300 [Russula earlei]